jgi:hypothetical protein
MDGAKLAKLCRDVKLLDKNLTSTDVDIIFSKVKAKTERKINYKQFEAALKLMAEKKYPGDDDGLQKLKAKIMDSGGPVARGVTKVVKAGAVDRLTDVSKFTGSHKERFSADDGNAKGKGVTSQSAAAGKKDAHAPQNSSHGVKSARTGSSSSPPGTAAVRDAPTTGASEGNGKGGGEGDGGHEDGTDPPDSTQKQQCTSADGADDK